jgi:hypothetical protein
MILHGHGVRWRMVVLPPGNEDKQARWCRCWVRRFRCTACGCCHSVLPEGVLLHHAYGLAVIVAAWMASVPPPLGQGHAELAVWALLGLDRPTPEKHRSGPGRWRSLSRWTRQFAAWWPGRSASGSTWKQRVSSLLTGFVAEARSLEPAAVTTVALGAHAAWGAAM